MGNEPQNASPVSGKQRFENLDFIRGMALFGILLMNIHWMAYGFDPYNMPALMTDETGANLWTWITTSMLFDGTQRATFSLLFGAGMVLLTSRLEASGRSDTADIYYRRLLWLMVFGMIHAMLILWLGDVLYIYALIGLFIFPFRNLAAKHLFILGLMAMLVLSIWNYSDYKDFADLSQKNDTSQSILAEGGTLNEIQQKSINDWQSAYEMMKPGEKAFENMNAGHLGSYVNSVKFLTNQFMSSRLIGFYKFGLDIIGMMFIGMALFKWGVLTLERPSRLYWSMLLAGYSIGLSMNYYEVSNMVAANFDVMTVRTQGVTHQIGRFSMTMGHLGLMMLFCRSGWISWFRKSMSAVGRMALTSYISHSVITAIIFNGFGFALFGKLERYELYFIVFGIFVFQMIISHLWLKYYRFGPIEWLWRSLTYVKRQKMRKIP